jgi:hypothetical protein
MALGVDLPVPRIADYDVVVMGEFTPCDHATAAEGDFRGSVQPLG